MSKIKTDNIREYLRAKYRGRKTERFTPGKEYNIVSIEMNDSTEVYLTSDIYDGGDIDLCEKVSKQEFEKNFDSTIHLPEPFSHSKKRHQTRIKNRRKIEIARNKYGSDYVNHELENGNHGEVYNLSYKCTCPYCRKDEPVKVQRKVQKMIDALNEYREGRILMKTMKVQCKSCKDIIYSKYSGHFVRCSCKKIFIDQTEHYIRSSGPEGYDIVEDEKK